MDRETAIVGFLRARLDEDEQAARAATPGRWRVTHDPLGTHVENGDGTGRIVMKSGADRGDGLGEQNAAHIARHDPARVLREVKAKREILDEMEALIAAADDDRLPGDARQADEATARIVLRLLAKPYAALVDRTTT